MPIEDYLKDPCDEVIRKKMAAGMQFVILVHSEEVEPPVGFLSLPLLQIGKPGWLHLRPQAISSYGPQFKIADGPKLGTVVYIEQRGKLVVDLTIDEIVRRINAAVERIRRNETSTTEARKHE